MTVSFLTAIDEIYGRFNDYVPDYMATALGYIPAVYWDDEELPTVPDSTKMFFRVQRFTVYQSQNTFATNPGDAQHGTVGLIMISIYTPRSVANGLYTALEYANYIRSIYMASTASGVWFRDQVIKDRTNQYNENFHHVTVQVTYEHSEVFGAV